MAKELEVRVVAPSERGLGFEEKKFSELKFVFSIHMRVLPWWNLRDQEKPDVTTTLSE